jgi:EmrB/QacA subfamily drug resistance transporter
MRTTAPDAILGHEVVGDRRRQRLILGAMCLALVAVVSSVSGLNVAQQALATDLDASQGQVLWVINGYTLVLAALLLPVGATGDRWGRKPVLLAGLSVFACANAASTLAGSIEVLIALRVVAGIGAAMVMPVTLSVITTSFPREEQARAIGTWAGFAGAGGIIGLFVSAAIIDDATWPWIFALPIALAAASFVLSLRAVPHAVEQVESDFDVFGSALSALAVGGSVLAVHEGPERGWTHGLTISAIVLGVVAAVGFVVVERRRTDPLLDVRMFADRALASGAFNLFVVFGTMFALFLVLVQHLQAVLGYSAIRAASGLLPMAALMMPLSTAAPMIAERFGYRRTVATGMALLTVGLATVALQADPGGGYLSVLPGLLVLALGIGLAMSPSTAAITSSLPEEKQGVASSLNDTVRELGGAVGIALVGSVLNATYRSNVASATAKLPPEAAEAVERGIGPAIAVASQAGAQGEPLLAAARQAYVDGMVPALLLAAGLTAFAAIFTAVRGPRPTPRPVGKDHPHQSAGQPSGGVQGLAPEVVA